MKASRLQSLLGRLPKSGYKSPWLSYPALYCVAIVMEIVYAFIFGYIFPEHVLWFDGPSYIYAMDSLASGKLDLTRTPTYPIILGVVKFIFSEEFIKVTIFIQILVYFASSILFQRIAAKFVYSSKVTFWIVAYYLLGIGFNQYHYLIMTESFSISGIVIFLYLLLKSYPGQLSVKEVVLSVLTLFTLVYLRPVFVYLIPITFIYFVCLYFYRKANVKIFSIGSIGLGLIIVSVVLYTNSMNKTYGIRSVSIVNTYNNYFMLRHGALPDIKYTDNSKLQSVISDINVQSVYRPYNVRVWNEIHRLITSCNGEDCTPGDFENYVYSSLKDNKLNCLATIRSRLFADDTIFPILNGFELISTVHLAFYPSILQSILLLFGLALYGIWFWRKDKQLSIPYLLLVLIVSGLWFSSIVGAYGDYTRLCFPTMPAFLIMLGSVTNAIISRRALNVYNNSIDGFRG